MERPCNYLLTNHSTLTLDLYSIPFSHALQFHRVITDMCQEVLRQMRGEVAGRLQAEKAKATASGGAAAASASAAAPLSKQQIATVLYRCFTDPVLMAKVFPLSFVAAQPLR